MNGVVVPRIGSPALTMRCSRSSACRERLASRIRFDWAIWYGSLCLRKGRLVEALRVLVMGRKGLGAGRRQTFKHVNVGLYTVAYIEDLRFDTLKGEDTDNRGGMAAWSCCF